MTNKNPRTILATVRVNARPYWFGRSHPLLECDEALIQRYYDGLANAPTKWAIILKTAYEYANTVHPNFGLDPTLWWFVFRWIVDRQMDGENLTSLALQYPQVEGSLVQGYYGSEVRPTVLQAKYGRELANTWNHAMS